jgi:hypothetical protein
MIPMDCVNKIEREVASPKRTHKVIQFGRDCGATTSSSTQLSIIPVSASLPDESGNIFIAGQDSLQVCWLSEKEILIKYPAGAEIFKRDTLYNGFEIRYEQFVIPDTFDSLKKIDVNPDSIGGVSLILGDWRAEGKHWSFQPPSKKEVTDPVELKEFCAAMQLARISRGPKTVHTDWLSISLQTKKGSESVLLQKNTTGQFHFIYKNDWYEGEFVADQATWLLKRYIPHK